MNIFINSDLQAKFDRDGYVVVSLLDVTHVDRLKKIYSKIQPVSFEGFSSTIYNQDVQMKKEASDWINEIVKDKIRGVLHSYRHLGCSFLCKTPGEKSKMPIHQDWTIVDESKFSSITVWMPLVDVNEINGAMKVFPGSHKFSESLRSPTLPGVFQQLHSEIDKYMTSLNIKAGQAIIFSQSLLHSSPPNKGNEERIVATFGLVQKDAVLSFYHKNKQGFIEKYSINDDFFLTYNNIGQPPTEGTLIDTFFETTIEWTSIDLHNAINKYKIKKMKPLFKDSGVQDFFNKNGFVRLKMLNECDVKSLLDFYDTQNLRDHSGYGFNMSIEDEDKDKVRKIREKIFEVALPKALPHFVDNVKVIAGSFVVKEKNPHGVVPPHQDWSFVENEGEYNSVTCWISLVKTNLQNGYMGVIKGSHLIYDNHRPSPSPQVPTPLMNHLFTIFPYLEMYEMEPGEALIFDHRTFHASTPNITENPRLAIGLGFTQGDAKLVHYNMKQNGKKDTLMVYEVDEQFSIIYDNSRLSGMYERGELIQGYKLKGELAYEFPNPSSEELLLKIKEAGNEFNSELCDHMARLFVSENGVSEKVKEEAIENNEGTSAVKKSDSESLPFWKVYTPLNIIREIKYRIIGG